jgi:hypothetical protein
LAFVCTTTEQNGFIDKSGKLVILIKQNCAQPFADGLAQVGCERQMPKLATWLRLILGQIVDLQPDTTGNGI